MSESWLLLGVLQDFCADDVNSFLPLSKLMFPKEPLMHTVTIGMWNRLEDLCASVLTPPVPL